MTIKDKLLTLPKKPGVYMHKDKDGNIIYVGKAINLFNRVNSYFRGAHDYKTTKLVSNIKDFDYIVTKSEKMSKENLESLSNEVPVVNGMPSGY